jgi:tetratricopeptide (TPR) repeat protein
MAFDLSKDEFHPERADMVELSRKILSHQAAASLHQFAGHPLQSGLHLEKVRALLQHWLVGATIQRVSVSDREDGSSVEIASECAKMLKQFPVDERLASESLFAFESKSPPFSLSDPEFSATPLLAKLDQARQLAQSGSRRQAQEVAYVAVHNWLKQVEKDPSLLSGQFIFEFNPLGLLNQLVELGLYADAIAAGEKFLSVRPEDRGLMIWLSELSHRIGDDEKAINLLYQVALFEPGQPETLRKLASIYEDRSIFAGESSPARISRPSRTTWRWRAAPMAAATTPMRARPVKKSWRSTRIKAWRTHILAWHAWPKAIWIAAWPV